MLDLYLVIADLLPYLLQDLQAQAYPRHGYMLKHLRQDLDPLLAIRQPYLRKVLLVDTQLLLILPLEVLIILPLLYRRAGHPHLLRDLRGLPLAGVAIQNHHVNRLFMPILNLHQ